MPAPTTPTRSRVSATCTAGEGALAGPLALVVGPGCGHGRHRRHLGHRDVPPRLVGADAAARVALDDDDGGAVGLTRLGERDTQRGDAPDADAVGAQAGSVRGQVDGPGVGRAEAVRAERPGEAADRAEAV